MGGRDRHGPAWSSGPVPTANCKPGRKVYVYDGMGLDVCLSRCHLLCGRHFCQASGISIRIPGYAQRLRVVGQ